MNKPSLNATGRTGVFSKPLLGRLKRAKIRVGVFVENISEATVACLFTMVQGNLMVLGLGHWLYASQTGIIAGTIASVSVIIVRINRRWLVALVLGAATSVIDFFVHPANFGPVFVEAMVTGLGAAIISYGIGSVLMLRARSKQQ